MHFLEIVDDLLVVLDEDGVDAHELRNCRSARRQVWAWAAEHSFDIEIAYQELQEYFNACRDEEARR